MATPTSGRTHQVSPDALPARSASRRPGQMPYFRVVDDEDRVDDNAITSSTLDDQTVTVQRRFTRAFTSDARIGQGSADDARESAA